MSAKSSKYAGASANYLLRHLIGVAGAIRARVGEDIASHGHELPPPTSQLLVNLPLDGLGLSELASRLRLTLQRTGQLVSELEELGYVERVPDEFDGRAKRVVYTARGRELVRDIDAADEAINREIATVLGATGLARLCRDLERLDRAFTGEDDVLRL